MHVYQPLKLNEVWLSASGILLWGSFISKNEKGAFTFFFLVGRN